ncbi:MAG: SCO family protein [Candidatus Thiodiazotropha sp. (ex Monitilora ramsayi)]|nr:SCO family protein [Candidatus Thiodiazotropha sp. (ex Monitilora ramsayi)]
MATNALKFLGTGVAIALAISSNSLFAGDSRDFEAFDVQKMSQPIKMDCVHQHARFLPSIGGSNKDGLQKVAMNMSGHDMQDHSMHQQMMSSASYSVSRSEYTIPDVVLTSDKGEKKSIIDVLNSDKPVMLNFIFTTCTTICPVLSASFSQVQEELGDEKDDISMVSISIDPEYDTADRLSAYAQRFEAGSQWEFFTGTLNDVVAVEKAFDIFRGSKMNHEPITLIRTNSDQPWLRIYGLANAGDIVTEYRKLATHAE